MSSRKNRTKNKHVPKASDQAPGHAKPSRDEAELAVRTLLKWIGDDPDREGLVSTPSRVVRAFDDWYSGYATTRSISCAALSTRWTAMTR